ncbi:MAG TPA: L-threonylcarbamoyladenylate synthase [Actinomycetes bacterium]|nr:L-threonylcarbamoyladenylate synthase [Actinomycetes bacterium]
MASLLTTDVLDAVRALQAGGLVAVPTETVYGLAADAENVTAVRRIYSVKGRPTDHPVIVHLPHASAVDEWAADVPAWACLLIDACWPGPLTLVLARSARAGNHLTGGQDTVGLRVPAHPLLHQVLEGFGGAVAAPSANRFGRVSPTSAAHVLAELGDALDAGTDRILDGGPSRVGVESTIVDATGAQPRILRPGQINADQIEQITGLRPSTRPTDVRAPGTLASHYSPRAVVVVCETENANQSLLQLTQNVDRRVAVLALEADDVEGESAVRFLSPDVAEYARTLYDRLRRADELGMDVVLAVLPPDTGLGTAVRDRLERAATRAGADPR